VVGNDLIQLGPVGVSTAQLGFHKLPAGPPDNRPPPNTPHIDVHKGDVAGGASSKGCVLTTLFTAPGGEVFPVSDVPRSGSVNLLVGNDPGDLFTTGVKYASYTLIDGGENYLSRENDLVSRPECRSGREGRGARIKGSRTPLSSVPWRQVRRNTASPRSRIRSLFPTDSLLDQAVDDLDGLGADFDRFATHRVGLGQSRACPWITDHNPSVGERRTGGGRTRRRIGRRA
jgi:hypothetical protein